MKVSPIRNDFVRMTGERYEPETDITCAICGYGIYRGNLVALDKNDEICHAQCVEKEGKWNKQN